MAKRKSNPDGIYQRRNADGTYSYVAQVRVRPFKPISKSFPTRAAAKTWATDTRQTLEDQRDRGADRTDLPALTVKTLIDEFLKDPETKTLRYLPELERHCAWWSDQYGSNRVAEMGPQKLRAAREKLAIGESGEPRAAGTINRALSAFRSCWNWGKAAGLIGDKHTWPTRLLLPEPKGRTRFLSDAELTKLLAVAQAHSTVMHTAIVVSIACGVRQGELLRLTWKDVDLDAGRMAIHKTKTDRPRAVFIPGVAVEALRKLKKEKVVSAKTVFLAGAGVPMSKTTLEGRWKTIREQAGLVDFRWHDLRHSCASFLAQRGATLVEIGSVLGHSSPSTTQRYVHLVQGAPVTGHSALDAKLRGALTVTP